MANLHERLCGYNLTDDDNKIGYYPFFAALHEYQRGALTGADVVSMFNLTTAQTTQATTLYNLILAAPNKDRFVAFAQELLVLGEQDFTPSSYRSVSEFVSRLEQEVIDQGGTPP